MKKLLSNWCVLVVAAIGVAALLVRAASYALEMSAFHADYGAQPPAAVFQLAIGQPVPDGVTELRVSGRAYFTRAWVWMRFRASESALKKLAVDDSHAAEKADMVLGGTMWVGNPRYTAADLKAVGWEDVRRIRTPVICTVNRPPQTGPDSAGAIWYGNMILDPDTHFVYVEMMCG